MSEKYIINIFRFEEYYYIKNIIKKKSINIDIYIHFVFLKKKKI